jgi:hypothetical protein
MKFRGLVGTVDGGYLLFMTWMEALLVDVVVTPLEVAGLVSITLVTEELETRVECFFVQGCSLAVYAAEDLLLRRRWLLKCTVLRCAAPMGWGLLVGTLVMR